MFGRMAVWLVCGVLVPSFVFSAEPLTTIAEVRSLTPEEAATPREVQVKGVVTWRNGPGTMTLQDSSAGIWISLDEAHKRGVWRGSEEHLRSVREGMEIEVKGISDPGGYAPLILPTNMRILGRKKLPPAQPVTPKRFFGGSDDCQRVEIGGVVQGFHPWANGVILVIDADPGHFSAQVTHDVAPDPAGLVDAEVMLRGVAATIFNARGEVTGSRVLASVAGDMWVTKPPPASDAVPKVALDRLLPFRAEPIGAHRVRVEGTVTFSQAGEFFYLQEGESAVRVESSSPVPLQPGDRVEASGFVETSRLIGNLSDAAVVKTGSGGLPVPVEISPEEILAINELAVKSGQVATPHDYDGHLIRCRGRLLAVQSEPDVKARRTLTLERANTLSKGTLIFRAVVNDPNTRMLDALQPGSDLEVTGLVMLNYAPKDPQSQIFRTVPINLDLILPSAADVRVIKMPSWWTARRFTAVIAATLLALAVVVAWNLQLKRQVRRKTRLLAKEMRTRRDASVEFQATLRERTRLAANLHDTLLQTISGVGFQIDACESEPHAGVDAPGHLEVARRMVDHAATELRNSVWALRSMPLDGMELPEAIEGIVRRVGAGHSTHIEVQSGGDLSRVPDFIAGNLLLFVQEAVQNALKHGSPNSVVVDVRMIDAPDRISLTVRDDGTGFTDGSQAGVAQGHFGLQGMRERIERLEGTLRIKSAPGKGTSVHAEVPLRHYDDEMTERPGDNADVIV